MFLVLLSWTLVLLGLHSAQAQVDPSSRLLLRGRDSSGDDYNSRRYTVKPKPVLVQRPPVVRKQEVQQRASTQLGEDPTGPQPPRSLLSEAEKLKATAVGGDQDKKKEDLSQSVKNVVLGGSKESISEYKSYLHPQDTHKNILEIEIVPGYFYNDSSSKYWYRNYNTNGMSLLTGVNVWFTPFFGVTTTYETSLEASVRAVPDGSNYIKADHKWFNAGLKFRSFFGLSRKSNSIDFGVGFYEKQFNVPSDSAYRFPTRTSGLKLSLELNIPKSHTYSSLLGIEFDPSLRHEENKSAIDVKSGYNTKSSALGVWYGGKFTFDRKNQFFWKFGHEVERNIFEGQADTADPLTSSQPEGVSVTNGTTKLQLGFTWGR